jgi:hypothetical protein
MEILDQSCHAWPLMPSTDTDVLELRAGICDNPAA